MVFEDVFNKTIEIMMSCSQEFSDAFTDCVMDVDTFSLEKIKKGKSYYYHTCKKNIEVFKRRSKSIELKLDTLSMTYIFDCCMLEVADLDKLPTIKLGEEFDFEKSCMRIGKILIKNKIDQQLTCYLFSIVKSDQHYHVICGKTRNSRENFEIVDNTITSFSRDDIHNRISNNSSLR